MHPLVNHIIDSSMKDRRDLIFRNYQQDPAFRQCINNILLDDGVCTALKTNGEDCNYPSLPGSRFCGIHKQGWRYIKGLISSDQVLKRQASSAAARFRQIVDKAGKVSSEQRSYLAHYCRGVCCPLKDLPETLYQFRQRQDECKYVLCDPPSNLHHEQDKPLSERCKPSCDKILAKILLKNAVRKARRVKMGSLSPTQQEYYKFIGSALDRSYKQNKCSKKNETT